MQNLLQKIRSQPPQLRLTIALALALACTAGIAAFWVWSGQGKLRSEFKSSAPSPFNALGASIKSAVKETKFKSTTSTNTQTQTNNQTQVIDAGGQSVAHDETNPYSATVTN